MENDNAPPVTPDRNTVTQVTRVGINPDVNKSNELNTSLDKRIVEGLMNSPIPIKILKNASFASPTTPTADHRNTPSPPQGKNYKVLYKEVTKRLFEQAEQGKEQYLELEEKYKKLVQEKDTKILSLQTTLGRLTESREEEHSNNEAAADQYRIKIAEHEKTIAELKKKISENNFRGLMRISSEEEIVRLKPKRNGKKENINEDQHKCQFDECGKKDADLTKCCGCGKWVCEACNDISGSKFKQLTNKCKRIYFMCKTCAEDGCNSAAPITDNSIIISSLQKIIEKKVNQFEANIEKVIDKKLGDKMDAVTALNEKIGLNGNDKENAPFSKILQVPSEVRKAIKDIKNDEKVELMEQEKRAQNFIIHGADEIGDTKEKIEENDATYIKDILKKLRVEEVPESITRLGKPNESKRRVMKICMKTKDAKASVMSNLGLLKGTEETFGKISVTEDYTVSEREKLREFSAKAKEQEKNDPTRVFKVRGDPKNGLRIISYRRQ